MNNEWKIRLAEPSDAASFAEWVAAGIGAGLIDPNDVADTQINPTTLYFVATKNGEPVAFAPCYLVTMLAHMGFDPQSAPRDRLRAMQVLIDAVSAFVRERLNVREIQTLTKSEYPIGAWSLKHGFKKDHRELFRFEILDAVHQEAADLAMRYGKIQ
jgi:hypothetical protein